MKSIFITGASTGIGYHLAACFAARGYRVFASVRKREDADRLAESIGRGVVPVMMDVTDRDAIYRAADYIADKIGHDGLAGLINNAGIAVAGPVKFLSTDDYRRQFEVNLFGTIEVIKAFMPLLGAGKKPPENPGKILNISSVSGRIGFPFMSPYNASKFALEGFSEALRRELMIYGIDVIVVAPGPIKTPIWGKDEGFPKEAFDSEYGVALKRFVKRLKRNSETGIDAHVFAGRVCRIFESRRPASRYTIIRNKLMQYWLPMYVIPSRTLDRIIFRIFRK